MEAEKFRSKGKCTASVIVEMVLSGLALLSLAILLVIKMAKQEQERREMDERDKMFNFNAYTQAQTEFEASMAAVAIIVNLIHGIRIIVAFFLLFAGGKVLSDACSLSPNVTDCDRLDQGAKACLIFSRLELFRMVLFLADILVKFFGQISFVNSSSRGLMTVFYFAFKLPIIFGWFFSGEFRKELLFHKESVGSYNLYGSPPPHSAVTLPLSPPVGGGGPLNDYHAEIRRQNQEFRDSMLYSAPAVAYCVGNLSR